MRRHQRPTCRVFSRRIRVLSQHTRLGAGALLTEPVSELERLAARLLARALATFNEAYHARPLHEAARQALALAEDSGFPLLIFPELFAELAIAALLQAEYRRIGRL